jgi:Xaa-Pro aminopeptidase
MGGMTMNRDAKGTNDISGRQGVRQIPFDAGKLDRSMEDAGLDVLVVTSKHNIQYLLGGYRFFFFDVMDAIGISRYLPVFVYAKGRAQDSSYIGNPMERYERELGKFWLESVQPKAWGTLDATRLAVDHIRALGFSAPRIGVEMAFLPADAYRLLAESFPDASIGDALFVLERLRAIKTPEELEMLRLASEHVVAAMLAVIAGHGPGARKRELVEALRFEEVKRGLTFEYCLITTGASHNRAPSDEIWREGDVMSIDSGGNYRGYIGDLCRMAIQGEPDQELVDLLASIDEMQQAARRPIRAGIRGGEVFAPALALLERSPHKPYTHFTAHGMGMVSHEAPRLTATGSVPYPGYDEERPLEAGMVLSIETTMLHPTRGYIKLEDTVAVTETGWTGFGDSGRGWNQGGSDRSAAPGRADSEMR